MKKKLSLHSSILTVTIKDKTPLPLIREVIDKLKETKFFNKLDLIWGYNSIQIKEGDK